MDINLTGKLLTRMMKPSFAVYLAFLSTAFSLPSSLEHTLLPLPVRTIAQLPMKPTWLESIVARGNGDLLATQFAPSPALYLIKSPFISLSTPELIYSFDEPNVSGLLGITQTTPDTFVIVAGNSTSAPVGYVGSWSAWSIVFSSRSSSTPEVRKIADLPAAKFLNGLVSLPNHPSVVLIAESQFGLVFRLDTVTGHSEVIADRPELKPLPVSQSKLGLGINGVKIRDGYLYFSNSDLISIFRVRITKDGYIAQGDTAPVELYADLSATTTFVDDFAFGNDGTLYVASNLDNTVITISPRRRSVQVVAGQITQLTVAGGTAAVFGRTESDEQVLYVCTAGGLAKPVNGTVTEPAKVVAVDTSGYKM